MQGCADCTLRPSRLFAFYLLALHLQGHSSEGSLASQHSRCSAPSSPRLLISRLRCRSMHHRMVMVRVQTLPPV